MRYAEQEADARRDEVSKKFGLYGDYILGEGQGYAAIPHAIDIYQAALGLSIQEAWYMKILCRYLPNIYPSMSKIAKQTGVQESKISRIKNGLIAKGYIRDNGEMDKARGKMNHVLIIMPFFDAVFLCIACDANSKMVIGNARDKVRAEFSSWLCNDKLASSYEEDLFTFELPLSLSVARKFAEKRGLELNWQYIESMQSGAAMDKLENITADKMRELEIKNAINEAISGAFVLTWYPKIQYIWLRDIAASSLRLSEVADITAAYLQADEIPTAKEYMKHFTSVINSPSNRKILVERGVNEAAYSYIDGN